MTIYENKTKDCATSGRSHRKLQHRFYFIFAALNNHSQWYFCKKLMKSTNQLFTWAILFNYDLIILFSYRTFNVNDPSLLS